VQSNVCSKNDQLGRKAAGRAVAAQVIAILESSMRIKAFPLKQS
jgi:hypothetical protein